MSGAHILIVDDDPGLREGLRRCLYLQHREWTVRTAGDGVEALRVLAQYPIDAVVTDLIMPEMEGIEMIEHLRRNHPEIPLIAMSGGGRHVGPASLQIAKIMGAQETLEKPFDPLLLARLLERMIERSSHNEEMPR